MDVNWDAVDMVDEVDEVDQLQIPRRIYIRQNYFETLSEEEFFLRFRVTKDTALFILNLIDHELEYAEDRNNSISPLNQLLLTLRFYATGGHFLAIGDFIQANKSTICKLVHKVTRAVAALRPQFIYMPRNALEISQRQNNFYDIAGFPKVIGAIDGSHVKILSPGGNDAEIYRNRKSYFSINVQGVCSADYLFQDIVARWPGSTHDATIFNNSRVKFRFENGHFGNGILLGDSGYMNCDYLLTPYLNPQNQGEQNYNVCHKTTRVKIENIFGIWKRRFPVMAFGCRMQLENVLPVIVATAVLHNIARLRGEPEPPNEDVLEHDMQQMIINGNLDNNIPDHFQNRSARDRMVNNYFSRIV